MKLSAALLITVTSIVAAGCATAPATKIEAPVPPKTVLSSVPDWYMNAPESTPDVIYVVGTAVSRDLAMGLQKAALDAETHLANKIAGEVSSMTKDYKREEGENFNQSTEIVTNKLAAQVKIAGGVVAKKEVFTEGKSFRVYVLMKYPVTNNTLRQLLSNKDGMAEFTDAKKAAEQELDRRVSSKKTTGGNLPEQQPAPSKSAAVVQPINMASSDPVTIVNEPHLTVKITPAGDASEEN